ncbi:hypothetical protein [Sunxiuqinia dokdonensis]|uniref:Uncharacterized protein n=1 Tax=Sunxiuqinia dokdonensis TaxID=1409788 RepID=A0A0L8VF12_9BACT|nr:hypothetical protein [Sunxiuqinia dokdonensis]KOH47065.1 hypothetical protein NC99_01080 [Sunxiuqinia dokdonensis]
MRKYFVKAEIEYGAENRKNVLVRIACFADNEVEAEREADKIICGWTDVEAYEILKVTTQFFYLHVFYVSVLLKYSNGDLREVKLHLRAEDEEEARKVANSMVADFKYVVSKEVTAVSK